MNHNELASALDEFDPQSGECRVVIRQAMDLADSGQFEADTGTILNSETVVRNLRDAPDERLPERWNWWIGSLEIAYGGYAQFQIQAVDR